MGILDEFKRLAHPYEDEDDLDGYDDGYDELDEDLDQEEPKTSFRAKKTAEKPEVNNRYQKDQKIVNLNSGASAAMQVVLIQPGRPGCSVDDIANHLIDKHTVVLNLQKTKENEARRLLDFLQGVIYPIHAKITPAADNTYIITPYNVEISGNVEGLKSENNSLFEQGGNGLFF